MNITEAHSLAINLMKQHGLTDWKFKFDRAYVRFGSCSSYLKKITLSKPLTELNDESKVKETILHEIAHALVGSRHQHNHIWRNKAAQIGAKPERCYSLTVTQPKGRWLGKCPNCSREVYKYRKPRVRRSCGKCSNKWNPAYQLVWKRV